MPETSKQKPNIVMILSDDQGAWALGCYGNREIQTPNLDRLARNGVRFKNFFCTSPVCSPARASILTGKIPSQHGIHDYLCEGNGGAGQSSISFMSGHLAYTELLSEQGYHCGLSGKWHLGDGRHPQKDHEFWYVHQKGGGPYYHAPMIRNGELVIETEYITDVITREALSYLDSVADGQQPFYLGIHYTAPHSPWIDNHPERFTKLYQDCEFNTCPQQKPHPWALTDVMPGYANPRDNLIGYFAAVTAMDEQIGLVMDKIESKGLLANTIICFMSDNGFNCGHHGIWGKGNGTFPLNLYDTSVKVPMILSWPGVLPSGKVVETAFSAYDFMPSLLELAGVKNPTAHQLPGSSFVPELLGVQEKSDRPVVVFDEYGPIRMIRNENHKYIHRYPYGPHEFYDLVKDPDETTNLYGQAGSDGLVEQMKSQMDLWFHRYVDPALDGTHEGVMGGGQTDLAGLYSQGQAIYRPNTHA